MPSVSVLYIDDGVIGSHLELIRNICEPKSKSRPHVTVRYFDKLSVPEDHLSTFVDHIDLLEPGSFGLGEQDSQDNFTVFLRCKSDDLLPLEHKPYFPTSEFHVTLYDGESRSLAKRLLSLLQKFEWSFRLQVPPSTALTEIQIKPKRAHRAISHTTRVYRAGPSKLSEELFGRGLEFDYLESLSEIAKINRVRKICESLSRYTKHLQRVEYVASSKNLAASSDVLNNHAIHLTPPELAQEIAQFAVLSLTKDQRGAIDFGDPAVGTGAFYSAVLKELPRTAIRSAIGVDISPVHVEAAKWRWEDKNMQVIEGDYLHLDRLPKRNLILANPPYLRHQGIPGEYKTELRQRASADLGMRISGLSGQYVYFVLLSHKWMQVGAVAAWLIPSEFMRTDYGAALRYYFTNQVELIAVHQFSPKDPQFENAEVLPCVVLLRNVRPSRHHKVRFSTGGSLSEPETTRLVDIAELKVSSKWSMHKRGQIEKTKEYLRIGDLFSVRRGIATGANEFFIMERKEAKARGIPDEMLKPILPKIKALNSDIIERLEDGYPDVDKSLCLFDSDMQENEIKRRYRKLWSYLESGKDEGVTLRYLVARRKPWYKQERRAVAPFLCTYMGKAHSGKPAIRFIWNKSDALVTNTYLMLYPHPPIENLLEVRPELKEILFNLLKDTSQKSLREYSREHAGGLEKIEPRELEAVLIGPMPEDFLLNATGQLF